VTKKHFGEWFSFLFEFYALHVSHFSCNEIGFLFMQLYPMIFTALHLLFPWSNLELSLSGNSFGIFYNGNWKDSPLYAVIFAFDCLYKYLKIVIFWLLSHCDIDFHFLRLLSLVVFLFQWFFLKSTSLYLNMILFCWKLFRVCYKIIENTLHTLLYT